MKIFPLIVLTTLGLLAGVSSHAQPCRIIGTIIDTSYNHPLIGANAILLGTARGTATNVEGEFVIDSLQPGEYTIKATYIGYHSDTVSVTLSNGETVTIAIPLEEDLFQVVDEPGIIAERPSQSSHAQPCKINGTITHKYTGEPLIGANAYLLGTNRGATTNMDGEFVIDSLEAGMYTIMFTYIGYLKDSAHVSLVHGETTSLEIALKDDPHVHYDHRDIPVVLISDKPNYNRVLYPSDALMMFYGVGRWD